MHTPHSAFTNALTEATLREKMAQTKFNRYASARLLLFIASVLVGWYSLQQSSEILGGIALICFFIFLGLIRKQHYFKRERNFQRHLQYVNQDELNRLQLHFNKTVQGQPSTDTTHPYTADLDIFGTHSLFALINRAYTAIGQQRLASWLRAPAEIGVILARQNASSEMSEAFEWRQKWQATALLYQYSPQQIEALHNWATQPLPESLRSKLVFRWWGIATLILIGAWLGGILPFWIVAINTLAQSILLKRFHKAVQEITDHTYQLGQTITAYAALFELVEKAPFRTKWWKDLPGTNQQQASSALVLLGKQFSLLDFRMNPYFLILVGIPTLWDLHCLAKLESWKTKYGTQLNDWLHTLAEIEAMNSLSGFQFAHPEYTMPEPVWENDIRIEGQQIGHPLIPVEKRVSNDFQLNGLGKTYLITGSNMSGKSTFLRTIGSNWVLAQMGAVVCAKKFVFTPVLLFTSMRTQDSLQENTSSFYAELKRLKQLIDLANAARTLPIFYMLDEILKGTNSADRHSGAQALITQLHPLHASGIVSTHDLELGEWGENVDFVTNYHFNSDVHNGQLSFDYTLKTGICQSFNASELMRMMGIQITSS